MTTITTFSELFGITNRSEIRVVNIVDDGNFGGGAIDRLSLENCTLFTIITPKDATLSINYLTLEKCQHFFIENVNIRVTLGFDKISKVVIKNSSVDSINWKEVQELVIVKSELPDMYDQKIVNSLKLEDVKVNDDMLFYNVKNVTMEGITKGYNLILNDLESFEVKNCTFSNVFLGEVGKFVMENTKIENNLLFPYAKNATISNNIIGNVIGDRDCLFLSKEKKSEDDVSFVLSVRYMKYQP